MGTVLGYILALLVVGGLLFLLASFAFGRGEEMAPVLPEGTPVELPDDRLARGDDLRAVRLSVALRGYRMDEVDWLLDRLAAQVDSRDREIARLRSVLHVEPVPVEGGGPDRTEPGAGEHRDAGVRPYGHHGAGPHRQVPAAAAHRDPEAAPGTGGGATRAGAARPRPVRDPEPLDPDSPRLGVGDPVRGLRPDGPAGPR